MMASGRGIYTTEITETILEELMLHYIKQDLQIVNSEEINLIESTSGHSAAEQCVKDMKNYINVQMESIKNYFDRKFNKQTKKTKEIKSGIGFALNKEIDQHRKSIFALERKV